ncbi:MAG: iron-containing alcohol dehydrogenase, partial [Candidatus Hydrogenedentales bacterium]
MSLPPSFRYAMPTEIVFGLGCFDQLADIASPFGKRPLLVTGRNSARTIGALDRALSQLPRAAVFDAVEENPCTATCERAAEQCRQLGCDHVIAIGGGSPLDVAKAVAALAVNPGPCNLYFGSEKLTHGALPVIAVPTTAGTGSEATPYAVIVDSTDATKRTITAKALFPRVALLDPELTRPMPRSVTVNTGLDALSQAMEGLVSRKSTPVSDTLAIDVIRRVRANLPLAMHDGDDIDARSEMLYAAMLSGCVIAQTGTTLVHGMGYYYTLACGIPHGLANGLLLTPIFQFNAAQAPDKVRAIVEALSGRPLSSGSPATQVAHELHAFFRELETSPAARDHGVDEGRLAGFAK